MDSKRWKPSTEHAPGQGPVTDADAEKEIARISIPLTGGCELPAEQFTLRLLRARARDKERIEFLERLVSGQAVDIAERETRVRELGARALLEVPDGEA